MLGRGEGFERWSGSSRVDSKCWGKPMQSEDKLGRAVGVGICLDERPADWVPGVHREKKEKNVEKQI